MLCLPTCACLIRISTNGWGFAGHPDGLETMNSKACYPESHSMNYSRPQSCVDGVGRRVPAFGRTQPDAHSGLGFTTAPRYSTMWTAIKKFTVRFVLALMLGCSMVSTRAQAQTVIALGSGFSAPVSIAVDSKADIFVADLSANSVSEILAVNGSIPAINPVIIALGGGFSGPSGIAVDASGNVFVADSGHGAVKEILAVDGSVPTTNPTINTLGSGFSNPEGVAVDGTGNVFLSDQGTDTVEEILAINGSIPATNPTIHTLDSGLSFPSGSVVDASGNVFFED
jgi:hypothetical protein